MLPAPHIPLLSLHIPLPLCLPKTDLSRTYPKPLHTPQHHPNSRKDPYLPKFPTQNHLPTFSAWPAFAAMRVKLTLFPQAPTAPWAALGSASRAGHLQEPLRSLTINWKTTPVLSNYPIPINIAYRAYFPLFTFKSLYDVWHSVRHEQHYLLKSVTSKVFSSNSTVLNSTFRDLYFVSDCTLSFKVCAAVHQAGVFRWDVKNHLPCPPTPSFVSHTDKFEEWDKNQKIDLIFSSLISPATLLCLHLLHKNLRFSE